MSIVKIKTNMLSEYFIHILYTQQTDCKWLCLCIIKKVFGLHFVDHRKNQEKGDNAFPQGSAPFSQCLSLEIPSSGFSLGPCSHCFCVGSFSCTEASSLVCLCRAECGIPPRGTQLTATYVPIPILLQILPLEQFRSWVLKLIFIEGYAQCRTQRFNTIHM